MLGMGDSFGEVKKGLCVLHPTEGSEVSGVVRFIQMEGYVLVQAEVTGLVPGKHGFHIHQWGDCACPDGKCAGGHFNPTGKLHGAPAALERHVGDLGNLVADERGKALLAMRDAVIQLNGPHSIIGRAIIVHAKADDLKSQPTGAAGARIACGVIGIGKSK